MCVARTRYWHLGACLRNVDRQSTNQVNYPAN